MQFGNGNSKTLAAIGDSLTADRFSVLGVGANLRQTYVALIAKAFGYANFVNAGIPGNTTPQMEARFDVDILAHRPARILIMPWTNDLTTNISGTYPSLTWTGAGIPLTGTGSTKEKLKAMVRRGLDAHIPVTLLTPPPQRYEPYLTHSPDYVAMTIDVVNECPGCGYMDIYSRINAMSQAEQDALYIPSDLLGHWDVAGHAYAKSMSDEPANQASFGPA